MNILTPTVKIHELLEAYPFLLEFLPTYNPKFSALKNPVLRNTMGRVATLDMVAGMGGIPVEKFIADLQAAIRRQTSTTTASPPVRTQDVKLATLKRIIRALHTDAGADTARAEFNRLIGDIAPTELAALEQDLIQEGMPVEEIHRLCDLHVNVFKDSLDTQTALHVPPGHPVHTYLAENQAILERANRLAELCRWLASAELPDWPASAAAVLEDVTRAEVHYTRKENQLFPYLEKHGFTGPSKVMWAIHDDIRRALKNLRELIRVGQREEFSREGLALVRTLTEMVYKEEKILFPTALQLLGDAEWQSIRAGDDEIGYAFVQPAGAWPATAATTATTTKAVPETGLLDLNTGGLTLKQLDRMLVSLPVEISFVDEHDVVRYYSGHAERIFPRSPAVIGRTVQNCHPQKSLHMVNAILTSFREGTRNAAQFWINFQGKFVLISYYAVRDTDGRYLGTTEVTQDITALRRLEGEKRLLDWS